VAVSERGGRTLGERHGTMGLIPLLEQIRTRRD